MNDVPHLRFPEFSGEWERVRLGNLCEVQMCKRIMASQTNPNDGVPFYKIGTIGGVPDAYISYELFEEYKNKYNYPHKGEVMITCAGTVGKCLLYNGEDSYYQDSNIVWLRNKSIKLDNGFLFNILSNINWSRLNSTTIVRIYNDDLRNLQFYLPPLDEQKKIVKSLRAIDERIATQNKIIEDLKKLKSAISLKMLHSDSWEQFKIQDIASIGRGRVISSVEISQQENPLYPVYSSQTSNDGIMGYLDDFMFEGEYISWTTDGANAGTVFYRNGKFNCTNVCGLLKLKKGFDAHFVSLVLAEATRMYVSTNLANPKLMNNTMGNIQIRLPKLEEQKRISVVFRKLHGLLETHNSLIIKHSKQKQYLLSQMFI